MISCAYTQVEIWFYWWMIHVDSKYLHVSYGIVPFWSLPTFCKSTSPEWWHVLTNRSCIHTTCGSNTNPATQHFVEQWHVQSNYQQDKRTRRCGHVCKYNSGHHMKENALQKKVSILDHTRICLRVNPSLGSLHSPRI